MQKEQCDKFSKCLFFATHDLAKYITDIAEQEFRFTGLSPTYAFLLMLVNETPGITPTGISKKLHLQPSTITRFVDKLSASGIIERKSEGKKVSIYPTPKGIQLQDQIMQAWNNLHLKYVEILGEDLAKRFTADVNQVNRALAGE